MKTLVNAEKIGIARIALLCVCAMLIVMALIFPQDAVIGRSLTAEEMLPADKMDEYALTFSSHLPIMVMRTDTRLLDNRETPPRAVVWYFDGEGENRLTDKPSDVFLYTTASYRGNSSYAFSPKKPYKLTFYDNSYLTPLDVGFFGLEPAGEWVLRSPYFDKSLMRDWFSYEAASTVLDWQPRGKPVQMFVQDGEQGNIEYQGVYYLCQHIPTMAQKGLGLGEFDLADSDGIDSDGGGYLFQLDRDSPYGRVVEMPNGNHYRIMYPPAGDMTTAQDEYLRNEITFYHDFFRRQGDFEAVTIENWNYRDYINEDSFIDYLLVAELLKNCDAGIFSTFMYRRHGEKLTLGPFWDSDLSMGMEDSDGLSTYSMFNSIHLRRFRYLFECEEFTAGFVGKWQEYRSGIWSDERLFGMFDEMAAYLSEPAEQNAERWPEIYDGETYIWRNPEPYTASWSEEIERTRGWLEHRLAWLDEYIPQLVDKGPDEINDIVREQS